jgi:CRP/FNR family transcriptional regulator, cyclic AMP receptor protein
VATAEHIAALAACFGCSSGAALQLAELALVRDFAYRTPLAHHGDPSAHLFLVLQGAASIEIFGAEGQQAQLARHGPGEIFGAYPDATAHRAEIAAMDRTVLLAFPTADLAALASANTEIGAGIARLLARQLDLVLDRMAARIGLSATGRFYRLLLQLTDDAGMICPAPVIAALAVSVHTSRETASRALTTLLRRGIVERLPDGLRVVSRRMLEDLVV